MTPPATYLEFSAITSAERSKERFASAALREDWGVTVDIGLPVQKCGCGKAAARKHYRLSGGFFRRNMENMGI
ncbi:MAG TPA: hypothetical protein VFQ69_09710 [Rhizomicrobium sp.]|nr:hypothetical protein [Rhizomicrobium sp.]